VAFRSFYTTFSCLIQSVLGVLALHTSHPPATPRPRARFCNALWLRRSFSTRCTEPARCTIACKLSVMTHSRVPQPHKKDLFITAVPFTKLCAWGQEDCGEEEVLFTGTQFSNFSTAVDTSAAAACNGNVLCDTTSRGWGCVVKEWGKFPSRRANRIPQVSVLAKNKTQVFLDGLCRNALWLKVWVVGGKGAARR
jgi:hypothetical protein